MAALTAARSASTVASTGGGAWVVTGANRGIGLCIARALKDRGETVVGTCRTSNSEIEATADVVIDGVDVGSDACGGVIAAGLDGIDVSVLINNAGIFNYDELGHEGLIESMRGQFEVNTLGPLRVFRAVRPFLMQPARHAIITSQMGSIADNGMGKFYGYRASKAALNAVGVSMAIDLADKRIFTRLIHPGFVATDMTDRAAGAVAPDFAAAGILDRIDELDAATTGSFVHAQGEAIPW